MGASAFNVAVRFAAMDAAKMEATLLKIRKSQGKVTTLTWTQLAEVLSVLDPGWKVEKSVGIVKLYGEKADAHEHLWDEDEKEVERRHKLLEKDAVTSLPASPKPNVLYVLDLTPIRPSKSFGSGFEFDFKPWMGAEGWTITTSNGKTIEVLPHPYDFGQYYHGYKKVVRTKIPTYQWLPVLNKETDWLNQIDKKLGLGAFEKAVPRTREGTGSCPVCFQNIKITDGEKIVLHGYRRPGTGTTHGSCEGVGFPAFELSVKGTKAYLDGPVTTKYVRAQAALASVKDPKVEEVHYGDALSPKVVRRGEPLWEHHLKRAIEAAEQYFFLAEADYKAYKKLVQNWKERPLPKEGERHIDWFYEAQKD